METRRRLEEEANLVLESSLDTTNRIIRTLEDTKEVGKATMVELDRQGSQLQRVSDRLNHIDQTVRRSNKIVNGMSLKYFLFPFLRPSAGPVAPAPAGVPEPEPVPAPAPISVSRTTSTPLCNDPRERQIIANLDTISDAVSDIMKMSMDMSEVLDTQNHVIGDIANRTEHQTGRVAKVTSKVQNWL